jgi:preprotein translocase subunit SecE
VSRNQENEVADRNRRGRDDDNVDEPIDDAYDDLDDDLDDLEEDDLEDEEDGAKPSRRSSAATATRARATSRSRTNASPGLFGRLIRRFRETVAELQKVIWPTRKELLTYTTVVVIFVALMMTFVSLLDLGFTRLMFLVFGEPTD